MLDVNFVVYECPPWKQIPADKDEKNRQEKLKHILQEEAKKSFKDSPLVTLFAIAITYSIKSGEADSANKENMEELLVHAVHASHSARWHAAWMSAWHAAARLGLDYIVYS